MINGIVTDQPGFAISGRRRASKADHVRGQRRRRRIQLPERTPGQPPEDRLQRGGRKDRAAVSGEFFSLSRRPVSNGTDKAAGSSGPVWLQFTVEITLYA